MSIFKLKRCSGRVLTLGKRNPYRERLAYSVNSGFFLEDNINRCCHVTPNSFYTPG